jgi:hypothetical protein
LKDAINTSLNSRATHTQTDGESAEPLVNLTIPIIVASVARFGGEQGGRRRLGATKASNIFVGKHSQQGACAPKSKSQKKSGAEKPNRKACSIHDLVHLVPKCMITQRVRPLEARKIFASNTARPLEKRLPSRLIIDVPLDRRLEIFFEIFARDFKRFSAESYGSPVPDWDRTIEASVLLINPLVLMSMRQLEVVTG